MSSNEGTVYMLRNRATEGSDDWVSPEPAGDVIADAVIEATDLDADDIDGLDTYVDIGSLRAVVTERTTESLTFAVEGHDVTITADGEISVDS
ncbi:HalOD1 output domain-containing protein [Haloarcula sp. KBTZ06]|uniref:HalOD1 output domain-containing protein n=1 Tax=Haloarcula sp. KBTZ06 TaxID=3402682 RepID=UPI003B43C825